LLARNISIIVREKNSGRIDMSIPRSKMQIMKTGKFHKSGLWNILVLSVLLTCLLVNPFNAQQKDDNAGNIILDKAFPFISSLQNNPEILKTITDDPELKKLTMRHKERIELSLKHCKDVGCYAEAIQWTKEETAIISSELATMSEKDNLKQLIKTLKEKGYYNLYASSPDDEYVKAVWNNVADGVGHILDVYIKGVKPFYEKIDSISFAANDENFREDIKGMLADEVKGMEGSAFFDLPVNISLKALLINQRDEAARYEPLDIGMNKTAFEKIKNIKWGNFSYSVILVPGQGPEEEGVEIDPMGISRCRMAAEYYKKGVAPFIVVSGGHVHPNKTPFCEAVEMKKYLVKELNIPEDVIFIEPHARHTTTNMRNTARMIYRFGIPADKKILIVTDPVQNGFLLGMEKRFMMELGCVPYRDLKKLSENTSEYFPDRNALQCNPKDPLDP
jgi:hypothetical protein